MLDKASLEKAIASSGISITAIASRLNISREGLYNKLGGTTEFKASEINKLSKCLHLSSKERDSIFFAN